MIPALCLSYSSMPFVSACPSESGKLHHERVNKDISLYSGDG